MKPEQKGAVLLLLGAVAIVALVLVAFVYSMAMPHSTGMPEGSCSFLLVSALLVVGFVGGAVWLIRSGRRD